MTLASLREDYRAMIFGAGGGIGAALCAAIAADPRCAQLYSGARRPLAGTSAKVAPFLFDLTDESSIAEAAGQAGAKGPLDLVIVATGMLQKGDVRPEKSWRALEAAALAQLFAINSTGPALIAKHTLGRLGRTDKAVFAALSARVGSIDDNRLGGWHAYRASKAALNMLLRNFAIELARTHKQAVCVGLHPGTVDTALSQPFQTNVPELFTPETSASHLLAVIDALTPAQSGQALAWDGARIAP
jgi:NAD(P)-dependent dehydrogenase (short-subunit alcohol dehydrogenase family)